MVAMSEPEVSLYYQGPGYATEIWGTTQANFLIEIPGRNDREVAVDMGDPVATFLSEKTGLENTPEFRADAARLVGGLRLRQLVAQGEVIDAIVTVSVDLLERDPELLAAAILELNAGK